MSWIKRHIGVCQQENNLDPDLTVFDNLRVFARYFDIPKKDALSRCAELLDFVGLSQKKDSMVDDLSTGMKRRLIIARALINKPEILLLDEPTTGLDPQTRHQVWDTVLKLKKQGVTVLLTTHYMEEAANLSDRVIIFEQGKIIVEGSPKELIDLHVGFNVIEIPLPEINSEKDLEKNLKEKKINYEKTSTRFLIYLKKGEKELSEVISLIDNTEYTLRKANLEDVFLKFTGRELRD
jgi:lipooligosaccharide transport system ATP-binding protein